MVVTIKPYYNPYYGYKYHGVINRILPSLPIAARLQYTLQVSYLVV